MTKKILLVDDDRDIHEHVRIVLEKSGYEFLSAFDGIDGLKKLTEASPDLIILDFKMPFKNGTEIYKEIRALPKYEAYRDTPVIMLTGCDQSDDEIKQLLELGLNAYLEKPFGHKELLNVIRNTFVINEISVRNTELRRQAEQSKNFLENLVSSCPLPIMTTDNTGHITFVSNALEEKIGRSAHDVLGTSLTDVFGPQLEGLENLEKRITHAKPFVRTEVSIRAASGDMIPMRLTYSRLRDHEDNSKGFLVVGEDLTDQKQLERERLERERLQAIMESLATISHEINNPLTPILGNLQLIRTEENHVSMSLSKKLNAIENNAQRINRLLKSFNQITEPIQRKYYGEAKILDLQT